MRSLWQFLIVVLLVMGCDAPVDKQRPNVIIIYTDDQAQWAMGAYGNKDIYTPNMDRLASEGKRFTRGFTKPVCSPSRVMLLTGRYSHRFDIPAFIPPESEMGLPHGTPTIASLMKENGYATGLFGKWHLGYGEEFYPIHFGFDVAEGYRHVLPGKHGMPQKMVTPINGDYFKYSEFRSNPLTTDILVERAVDFIQDNRERPFFLYLATHLPHLPWHPIPELDEEIYKGKSLTVPDTSDFNRLTRKTVTNEKLQSITREYYACVSNVDRNIGKILDVLDQEALSQKTMIIFIGDNGFMIGHHGAFGKGNARNMYVDENGHYGGRENGTHPNMFDNSILVPFVVKWPGVIPPGTKNEELVSTIDVLPTVAEICGFDAGETDGNSLYPLLQQRTTPDWRRSYFDTYDMIHLGDNGETPYMRMIRTDDWKLVLYQDEDGQALDHGSRHELYHIKADPDESDNLYGSNAVSDMQIELDNQLRAWMNKQRLK